MSVKRAVGIAVLSAVAGCGPGTKSLPAAAVASVDVPVTAVPTTVAAVRPAVPPVTGGVPIAPRIDDADALARQADAHAAAIEALLAAREREEIARRVGEAPAPVGTTPSVEVRPPEPVPAPAATRAVVVEVPPELPPLIVPPPAVSDAQSARANTAASIDAGPAAPPVKMPVPDVAAVRPPVLVPADDLETMLAGRVKDDPRDVAAQLDYQLALFLKGDATPRSNDLTGLIGEDREVVTALIDGLANFRSAVRSDRNLLLNRKLRPLLDMSDQLRQQADLAVTHLMLCRRVDRFGVYVPFEAATFEPQVARRAVLYCEVENFGSRLTERNGYETKMRHEAVMYTPGGEVVWRNKVQAYQEETRSKLRDLFMSPVIEIPMSVPPGRYSLKLTMTDLIANRVAEASVVVTIK